MSKLQIVAWLMLLSVLFIVPACGGGGDDDDDDDTSGDDDDDDTGDDDDTTGDDDDDDDDDSFDPQDMSVQFYDVGLGDATLIEIPGPYTMLVDGGAVGEGTYNICNDLAARGIDRIDVMVMTHPHYDHCGGLSEIFDCADVGEVWTNGAVSEDEAYQLFAAAVEDWGGTVVVKQAGDVDTLGGATITTLSADQGYADDDDNSLVQLVAYDGWRVLMTADIGQTAQQALADNAPAALACDAVKIPDHGMGPASQDFIAALGASIGVLSVGGSEPGYPTADVIAAYVATGLDLYRTDDDGTVRLTFGDTTIAVETEM